MPEPAVTLCLQGTDSTHLVEGTRGGIPDALTTVDTETTYGRSLSARCHSEFPRALPRDLSPSSTRTVASLLRWKVMERVVWGTAVQGVQQTPEPAVLLPPFTVRTHLAQFSP